MLFKKKEKPIEPVDERTELEKKIEEKGSELAKNVSKVAQRSVDEYQKLKEKIEHSETLKVTKTKTKEIVDKSKASLKETKEKMKEKTKKEKPENIEK